MGGDTGEYSLTAALVWYCDDKCGVLLVPMLVVVVTAAAAIIAPLEMALYSRNVV